LIDVVCYSKFSGRKTYFWLKEENDSYSLLKML